MNEKDEQGATPRQQLIKAAGNLDTVGVRNLINGARTRTEKKALLDRELCPGVWGACRNESALHAALQASPRPSCSSEKERKQRWMEVLCLLLENGANPNDKFEDYNWKGRGSSETAFDMVLERGALDDVGLLKLFLDAGADPTVATTSRIASMRSDGHTSHTPLHTVVKGGIAVDCAIELIKAGADVNARKLCQIDNERGYNEDSSETPLHIAVEAGSVEMCSLLLSNGANTEAEQKRLLPKRLDVESPTDDPRDPNFVPSIRMVPVCQRALHLAIKENNPDLVRLLVLHGADKKATCTYDREELMVDELCSKQEIDEESKRKLRDALAAEWSTDTHTFFPDSFKKSVRTTLLTAKRQGWPLGPDVLSLVFANAAEMKVD